MRVTLKVRMCRWLSPRRSMLAVSNVVAAASFVVGCIGFYWPSLYTGSVSAFLFGSVLFFLAALGSALLEQQVVHPVESSGLTTPSQASGVGSRSS